VASKARVGDFGHRRRNIDRFHEGRRCYRCRTRRDELPAIVPEMEHDEAIAPRVSDIKDSIGIPFEGHADHARIAVAGARVDGARPRQPVRPVLNVDLRHGAVSGNHGEDREAAAVGRRPQKGGAERGRRQSAGRQLPAGAIVQNTVEPASRHRSWRPLAVRRAARKHPADLAAGRIVERGAIGVDDRHAAFAEQAIGGVRDPWPAKGVVDREIARRGRSGVAGGTSIGIVTTVQERPALCRIEPDCASDGLALSARSSKICRHDDRLFAIDLDRQHGADGM